jgi:hypothetical protein
MRWTQVLRGCACQLADGREHYPPMPKQDADFFEVVISQMRECRNTTRSRQSAPRTRTCRVFRATPQFAALRGVLAMVVTAHVAKISEERSVVNSLPCFGAASPLAPLKHLAVRWQGRCKRQSVGECP